jgi:hypothetical protein
MMEWSSLLLTKWTGISISSGSGVGGGGDKCLNYDGISQISPYFFLNCDGITQLSPYLYIHLYTI